MKYIGATVAVFCFLYIAKFSFDAFGNRGAVYSRIDDHWKITVGDKKVLDAQVPGSLDNLTGRRSGSRATYERSIHRPDECRSNQCFIFLGEIGDMVSVFADGKLVRSQGYSDGFHSLAKMYPVWFEFPRTTQHRVDIKVEVESLYGIGFGLTKGPYFIGDYSAVRTQERFLTLQSVMFPLMQALMLAVFGFLSLMVWRLANLDQTVFLFGVFTLAEAAFMVSFSFLPREYLAVTTASAIHFSLRVIADLSLFELVHGLLPVKRPLPWVFRTGFGASLVWYATLFIRGTTYPDFVFATQVVSILIVSVPLIGLLVALQYLREDSKLPSPRYLNLRILIPTLLVLTAMQFHDTFIFWGLFSGAYWIKFYLTPLAFVFASVIILRHIKQFDTLKRRKAEAEKDAILGRIAMEFSHDLKSPLGSLRDWALMATEKNDPEFTKAVLENVVVKSVLVTGRLQELFSYAKDEIRERGPVELEKLVREVQSELQLPLQEKRIRLDVDVPKTPVVLDASSFKRAVLNLLDNAIFASGFNTNIRVSAKLSNKKLIFSIQDYGCGIEVDILPLVFEPYFTTNKPRGTGLGLAIVDRITRQHGGHVHVISKKDSGSTFIMEVPV